MALIENRSKKCITFLGLQQAPAGAVVLALQPHCATCMHYASAR
jgi:hypothetical protein